MYIIGIVQMSFNYGWSIFSIQVFINDSFFCSFWHCSFCFVYDLNMLSSVFLCLLILTWRRFIGDQAGRLPRVRPQHCTELWLTPANSPSGNLGRTISSCRVCVRANPNKYLNYTTLNKMIRFDHSDYWECKDFLVSTLFFSLNDESSSVWNWYCWFTQDKSNMMACT